MEFPFASKPTHGPFRKIVLYAVCAWVAGTGARGLSQKVPLGPLSQPSDSNSESLLTSTVPPGTLFLFGLERKMAAAVASGGGSAFASYFDENGMTLANKQAPVVGRDAIRAHANWSPARYRLTWSPEGGELSPSGDMGYTWGTYVGRTLGSGPGQTVQRGRYVTVWKKESDGSWKILIDSSNEEPPEPECKCSVTDTP